MTHGQPARLLCPRDFPGKNTGVGCHSLLQGFFLIQGSNLGLLHYRQTLYHLSHWGRLSLLLRINSRKQQEGKLVTEDTCPNDFILEQERGRILRPCSQRTCSQNAQITLEEGCKVVLPPLKELDLLLCILLQPFLPLSV